MSLLAALPRPKNDVAPLAAPQAPSSTALVAQGFREPPPYLRRQNFIPRKKEDFGDGGSFPEIHVAQYPLDLGKGGVQQNSKTLAVTINADGDVNFDAVLRQGQNKNKIIHSTHRALVPKVDAINGEGLARPDEEEVEKAKAETAAALLGVVEKKMAINQVKALPSQPGAASYIKYTPSQQGAQFASGAGQRIIKMQDMPVDPLEPPKFRHTKAPRGPGSPPVPVMHSPPRAVSTAELADWKIPPSISNWKNPKGYTIPLDKRLAADGRGLQVQQINDKFAGLAEALQLAEKKAREQIEFRNRVQQEIKMAEKARKEQELRELAMRARQERAGGLASRAEGAAALPGPPQASPGGYDERPRSGAAAGAAGAAAGCSGLPPPPPRDDRDYDRGRGGRGGGYGGGAEAPEEEETAEERRARREREELMSDRKRERERERRLESREGGAGASKKSKLTRDRDRDVGEKMALGMAAVGGAGGGADALYDSRLFNQEQGMGAGFGQEDSYNMYDKPLFADRGSNLYRPKAAADDELYGGAAAATEGGVRTEKFKADRTFQGAEYAAGPRTAPVEFEKNAAVEEDPFGLNTFFDDMGGKSKKKGALDGVGQRGGMGAAGGGGRYEDYAGGSGSRRMDFTSGKQ